MISKVLKIVKILWRIFKELVIGILLVLSLWLVGNAALKLAKMHFEFGSLMDFFNTLGTLGTFYIAYQVYKNAPQWLSQKFDEESLKYGLEINDFLNNKFKNNVQKCMKDVNELHISSAVHEIYFYNSRIGVENRDAILTSAFNRISAYSKNKNFDLLSEGLKEFDKLYEKLNLIEWHLKNEKMKFIEDIRKHNSKILKLESKTKFLTSNYLTDKHNGFYNYEVDKKVVNDSEMLSQELEEIENGIKNELFGMVHSLELYGSTKSFRTYFIRLLE